MKKINIYVWLLLAGGLLASCDADSVDGIDFDVNLRNEQQEIYVGDEVIFDFDGNPDYIVFYSGEDGCKYANKDRLKVDVESMNLSYTMKQVYTKPSYQNRANMHIYVSEDFKGLCTAEGIEEATWTELSGEGGWRVPTCPNVTAETVTDNGDLSGYMDKKFYLAFRYETPASEEYQPRFDIEPLTLTKTVEGQEIKMTNPEKEFGFTYVFPKGKPAGNYNPSATRLLFQPSEDNTGLPAEIWAISKQLDPSAVSPDEGTPIKSLDMTASSYTYTYMTPGEYVVTFVARNANMWNVESVVREIKITVKER
jgi:hypothetical protein